MARSRHRRKLQRRALNSAQAIAPGEIVANAAVPDADAKSPEATPGARAPDLSMHGGSVEPDVSHATSSRQCFGEDNSGNSGNGDDDHDDHDEDRSLPRLVYVAIRPSDDVISSEFVTGDKDKQPLRMKPADAVWCRLAWWSKRTSDHFVPSMAMRKNRQKYRACHLQMLRERLERSQPQNIGAGRPRLGSLVTVNVLEEREGKRLKFLRSELLRLPRHLIWAYRPPEPGAKHFVVRDVWEKAEWPEGEKAQEKLLAAKRFYRLMLQ